MTAQDQIKRGVEKTADILRGSNHTIALTGAGISTPSGIPDFRSPTSGLWEMYDPFEVASMNAFRYNPDHFFNWMRPLARNITRAQPNPAHIGLARLEDAGYIKTIITQNIDGLHQRAGSKNVLEVHGSLRTLTCIKCYQQYDSGRYSEAYLEQGVIPRCEHCSGTLKPDVILYGEQLPARTWMQAQEQSKKCEAMIVAGSSLEVLPVAGLPMRAVEKGASLVIINQSETYIDVRADVVISDNVAEVIPLIVSEVLGG